MAASCAWTEISQYIIRHGVGLVSMSSLCEKPVIAVVDDDTAYLGMLYAFLSKEEYDVVCGLTAAAIMILIRDNQPELLILDIRLEHSEAGCTALELLRLVPRTKELPVIICSADSWFLRGHERQLRKYRCEILHKPFDLDQLLAKIIALVGPAQLRVAQA
jgi:DNA-binding response OmpR family regulator